MAGLTIRQDACELDFLSLGALVHRLDPGIIPFRKATHCDIHVSGGEFNVAANLADCFRLNTGIASAMVDYPIGELIAERVRAMGVKPFIYKDSVATKGGLKGNQMIVAVNGQSPNVVGRSFEWWFRSNFNPGDEIVLSVQEEPGKSKEIRYILPKE